MEQTILNPNKRINVISILIVDQADNSKIIQEPGILMRTTRSYAAKLIAAGTHTYTSKSKLKSFINKNKKLWRNERTLSNLGGLSEPVDKHRPYGEMKVIVSKGFDLSKVGMNSKADKKDPLRETYRKSQIIRDHFTGKTYLSLWKRDNKLIMESKTDIDPATGKIKKSVVPIHNCQLLILKFPS